MKTNFSSPDEDVISVGSSEQDFDDGGISEISNQELKHAHHKSFLDSLQFEDDFNEWLMKERLGKPEKNNNSGNMSNGLTSSDSSESLIVKKELKVIKEESLLTNGHKQANFDSTLIATEIFLKNWHKEEMTVIKDSSVKSGTIKSKFSPVFSSSGA